MQRWNKNVVRDRYDVVRHRIIINKIYTVTACPIADEHAVGKHNALYIATIVVPSHLQHLNTKMGLLGLGSLHATICWNIDMTL